MKKFKKCFSALFLSCFLAFGNISGCYLEVQAFEWVVPSLTVGDSILWLMGLLGISYTEGASAWRDVSPEYEQDFIDYANAHGLTYNQTSTWLNDTASGKLNQLSDVWSTFKDWVSSFFVSNNNFFTANELNTYFLNLGFSSPNITYDMESPCLGYYKDLNGFYSHPFCGYNINGSSVGFASISRISFLLVSNRRTCRIFINNSSNSNSFRYYYSTNNTSQDTWLLNNTSTGYIDININEFYNSNSVCDLFLYGINENTVIDSLPSWGFTVNINPISLGASSSDDFDVYNPAIIPDINFADSNTEDASIPGVIDLPWGNLGDDEEERDKTYDDLVGGLDLGQEIGDLWQALQDLMGVLAVDDTGVLQPNDGGENPPTFEDEVEENKVNGAFVLSGLQKVFPFCIPFDLYAFMTLLVAEPVAPVINWPIYNPITDSNEIITIDFSTWESVVILLRYIFDFLFIVGLLLMARALIGGGDSA